MPTSAFLMQLIVMLHKAGVQLAPSHMKRDYNQWADELTHPGFAGFRSDRQLHVSEAFSQFKFLYVLCWTTNHQDRTRRDVRPIQRPPKVLWSLVVDWMVVWALLVFLAPDAKAPDFDTRVEMLCVCDTATSFGSGSWREPNWWCMWHQTENQPYRPTA